MARDVDSARFRAMRSDVEFRDFWVFLNSLFFGFLCFAEEYGVTSADTLHEAS